MELSPLPPLLRVLGVASELSSERSSPGLGGLGFRRMALKDQGGVATTVGMGAGGFGAGLGIPLVEILAHLLVGNVLVLVLAAVPLTEVGATDASSLVTLGSENWGLVLSSLGKRSLTT